MNVYIISYICIGVMSLLYPYATKHIRILLYGIGSCILFVLICFRKYTIGRDVVNYYPSFCTYQNLTWRHLLEHEFWEGFTVGWEGGYVLFNKALGCMIPDCDVQTFVLTMGMICVIPLLIWIPKNSTNPVMSLLVFMTFHFYVCEYVYRAWMALLIAIFWSLNYIKGRKFLLFITSLVIASLFHRSILLMFPLYFIYDIKITPFRLLVSSIVALLFLLTGNAWREFFNLFARIQMKENFAGGIPTLILLWLTLAAAYIFLKQYMEYENVNIYYKMAWIAAVTDPLSFSFPGWARVVMFFTVSLWSLFPWTIDAFAAQKGNYKFAWMVRVVFMGLMFVLFYMRVNSGVITDFEKDFVFGW